MASEDGAGDSQSVDKKKLDVKRIAIIAVIAAVAIASVAYWYVNYKIPHDNAVAAFNAAVDGLDERNAELDSAISELQDLMNSGETPLDQSTIEAASATIGEAQGSKQIAPEMPNDTEEINAEAAAVESMGDYASQLDALSAAKTNLQNSIAQMKQVTNPSEQFVIQRITGLANITGVEAVTENNDPNGNLGKAGGYTACVYFSSDLVDQSKVYISDGYSGIVGAGTDGGGAVEVYANVDDANKRNNYLAVFDGGVLSSGSHDVVGTCIVRTSHILTASQQKMLEGEIVDSLTRLE
jgi:prefoldin subunit 5